MTTAWTIPVPAEGMALRSLVITGSDRDLEVRLGREEVPPVRFPVSDARVTATDDVALDLSRSEDACLSLEYTAAPGLSLIDARVLWDEEFLDTPEVEERLSALFGGGGEPVPVPDCCLRVELSLAGREA
ncbi:hypothetical protein [Nocardiopsis sp. FR6]|uniref:hypothetical protein n=1 Tax=Nocardiopsis sp. FR6 TaxID=2605986 RepID=UPI00135C9A0E|nr:hypothetical protein [Nocardiopsis sp. FR6]